MAKHYIVWNESKSEGFVTTDEQDALQVLNGRFAHVRSSAGEAFRETYPDDNMTLERVGY